MKLQESMREELIRRAFGELEYAYAPYSKFKVAAALLTKSGKIYTGCNIENAALSPGNCAERTAIFKAVSEGEKDFAAICIVNEDAQGNHDYCPPCGVCRQVMREFCRDDFRIYLGGVGETYEVHTLAELLPFSFSAERHMK